MDHVCWRKFFAAVIFCVSSIFILSVQAQDATSDVLPQETPVDQVENDSIVVTASKLAEQAQQCPTVDCDCESISGSSWVQKCYEVEQHILNECAENGGVPQSYCGIHGPAAAPVALSLGETPISVMDDLAAVASAKKQIAIKYWSLTSDLRSIEEFLDRNRVAEALQTQRLFERNLNNLFGLHYSVHRSLVKLKEDKEAEKVALNYIDDNTDIANTLNDFSERLWKDQQGQVSVRAQKAYQLLSFRMGRSVGKVYEHSAAMLADVGQNRQSAKIWQSAANIAQRLAAWAESESKGPTHVNAYRQQALARLHRAAYYWLASEKSDLAVLASADADEMTRRIKSRQSAEVDTLIGVTGGLSAP